MDKIVNILIVDDSAMVRCILKEIFDADPALRVVGEAVNGRDGVEKTRDLRPDIITMDIQMPEMDGFEATEEIMANYPTPILIFSSAIDKTEQYTSFKAISLGALDNMAKPDITQAGFDEIAAAMRRKVKILARINVIRHIRGKFKHYKNGIHASSPATTETTVPVPSVLKELMGSPCRVIAVGASTGGPMALKKMLAAFPHDFPAGFVLVQHITAGFDGSFVEWLDTQIAMKVKLAKHNETVSSGVVYVAPCGYQLTVAGDNRIQLDKNAPLWGEFKPSVNTLFQSVARNLGSEAVGVILTGMGSDGAEGLKEMYQNGAFTIAQDESSSLIFGMPRAAIEMQAVRIVLALDQIPDIIFNRIKG